MTERIPITPQTRVAALLDAYPELEEVLIRQAPSFRNLRNPILRRTVARVATLEKAARVGGIRVQDLVVTLRRAAGLPVEEVRTEGAVCSPGPVGAQGSVPRPPWIDEGKIRRRIDADRVLAAGEVPLEKVEADLEAVAPGEIVCLESGFRPDPLLEHLQGEGHGAWVDEVTPGRFRMFVERRLG